MPRSSRRLLLGKLPIRQTIIRARADATLPRQRAADAKINMRAALIASTPLHAKFRNSSREGSSR
jgi:hypothetical protein